MKTMLPSLLMILPIAVTLAAGSASAQSNYGGNSDSSPSGEGSNSGVAPPMTCATGAYCPPGRGEPRTYARQPPRRIFYPDPESCDQVRVRERIPGTNRYRTVYRCDWDR